MTAGRASPARCEGAKLGPIQESGSRFTAKRLPGLLWCLKFYIIIFVMNGLLEFNVLRPVLLTSEYRW